MGPYGTILDHTGSYGTILDYIGPYRTIREGSKKKNYESSDICPNWVYPTYLVA